MTALIGAILAIAFGTAIALRLLSGGGQRDRPRRVRSRGRVVARMRDRGWVVSRLVKWRDRAIWIAIAAAVIVIVIQDAREAKNARD